METNTLRTGKSPERTSEERFQKQATLIRNLTSNPHLRKTSRKLNLYIERKNINLTRTSQETKQNMSLAIVP